MIISASRRTDIPAFFSDWFFNRLQEGYVLVPYPRNPGKYRKVLLNKKVVDCFVFWTKNPAPMIGKLDLLSGYDFIFHYTVTPYEKDIEAHLHNVERRIELFNQLSEKIGKERLIWRYDPIFVSERYSILFHIETFERMASLFSNHTNRCMISFIDDYNHVKKTLAYHGIATMKDEQIHFLAAAFSKIAAKYNISLQTCAENSDLSMHNIARGACIDRDLLEQVTGKSFLYRKDKNQRALCNCLEGMDIGAYDTCSHGCLYCYATTKFEKVLSNVRLHDKTSPLLFGYPKATDEIIEAKMTSLASLQGSLFVKEE